MTDHKMPEMRCEVSNRDRAMLYTSKSVTIKLTPNKRLYSEAPTQKQPSILPAIHSRQKVFMAISPIGSRPFIINVLRFSFSAWSDRWYDSTKFKRYAMRWSIRHDGVKSELKAPDLCHTYVVSVNVVSKNQLITLSSCREFSTMLFDKWMIWTP